MEFFELKCDADTLSLGIRGGVEFAIVLFSDCGVSLKTGWASSGKIANMSL